MSVGAKRVAAAACRLAWSVEARTKFTAVDIAVRGRRVTVVGWRGRTIAHGLILERNDRGKWLVTAPTGRMKLETTSSDGAWIGGTKYGKALVMHRIGARWGAVESAGIGPEIDDIDANRGDVWVVTNDGHGGGLFGLRAGRWSRVPSWGQPWSVAAVGGGTFWLGGSNGIAYWTGRRWIHQVRGFDVMALAGDSPSRAWGLDSDVDAIHSLRWDGRRGSKTVFALKGGGVDFPSGVLLNGPGGVWAATGEHLAHWSRNKWSFVALPRKFASDSISAMAGTPNALWLALNGLTEGLVLRGVCHG